MPVAFERFAHAIESEFELGMRLRGNEVADPDLALLICDREKSNENLLAIYFRNVFRKL